MPAPVFGFLKYRVRPTRTDQPPQPRLKFIHPCRNPPGVLPLAEPLIAAHRPINVVFAPPYRTHSRKDGVMTCGTAVPGVWWAGGPMKLGRVRIGTWGYVPRAGAGCTRMDTKIAGCVRGSYQLLRTRACLAGGRPGHADPQDRAGYCKLWAEVWDESDIGNDVCRLTQPETAGFTSAGGECEPNLSKPPAIPTNDCELGEIALGETERAGELRHCDLRAGATAPLSSGAAQNIEN